MNLGPYAARTATGFDRRARGSGWLLVEGTLLKVDLSGFTRLSERLARSEVTGAELLNATLNDVFVGLIDELLVRGGDVLQFGGDALLVWFEDDDHAVRAVAAARAMQRRVASRAAEPTPAGPVRLRMSAAVASGEVLFTVVGGDHRELLTLGPVATRVELLEKRAASGQVVLDDAAARALPAREVVQVAPELWRSRGVPSEGAVPATSAVDGDAAAFVPPDVREVEAAGEVTGEHRHAAAAFVGLTGLDDLMTHEGPAAVVDAVVSVSEAVDEAVAATRVTWTATDLMADGAVFLLFAGAPVAREDDEERMLRACRIVADRCAGLDVRIGAHAGRVFAADIGHPDRRTFAIIGDTTNLAARLMHRADVGAVLVTDELFGLSEQDHAVQWLEPFTVRGRRRHVRAGVLGARIDTGVARRTHDLPLVGRDRERARLRDLVAGARGEFEDAPRTLALLGDPGVGKSRLVEELLADAGGLEVLRLAPTVFDTETPYGAARGPLRELLRLPDGAERTAARLAELSGSPELVSLLNLPLGLELRESVAVAGIDPAFVETRRNELLADVLAACARPLLVVVEDLHWLDRATAGLVETLARRTAPRALGVLVTSRTSLGQHLASVDGWIVCELEPLGPEEARKLALELPGESALSDSDLARLVADSGGNPLFLRELASFRPAPGEPLPTTADEVIAARIDALGPARRRLLRETSVGGPVQLLDDVATTLGDQALSRPATWSGLGDFVTVEPVGEETVLRFRHELYRQSAYQGLAVRRRRTVHARWADHLLADARPRSSATLAVHLYEAQRYAEAWDWGRRAAEEARAGGALSDAVPLYVRALDAGRRADVPKDHLASTYEELGDTAELVGLYDQAANAFATAARNGAPELVARRLVKRGTVLERQGRYRSALAQLTRAERRLDEAGVGVTVVRTGLALRRSSVLHRLGRLRPAYDVAADVARATAEGAGPDLRGDRARALLRLEMIASEAGWPQRFDLGLEALAAFEGIDEDRDLASLLGNLGVTLAESDDWTGARRRYEESIEVYQRVGDVVGAAIAAQNVGEILCDQGLLREAEEVFLEARRVFRAAGHAWGVACTASALGRVAARTGDADSAGNLLDEAVTSLDAMGSVVFAADARVRQVEAALLREDPDVVRRAESLVEHLEHVDAGLEAPLAAARYLALAAAGGGSLAEARQVASDALHRAVEAGVVHEESLLLDVLAGLDVLEDRTPPSSLVSRRDSIWERLGIVAAPSYPQVPRVDGSPVVSSGRRTNCSPADRTSYRSVGVLGHRHDGQPREDTMTSNEKFQPGEETFEDVEGHGRRFGMAEQPAEDDTEGHAARFKGALPADADVEGHAVRAKVTSDDEDGDDTEGHATRVRV